MIGRCISGFSLLTLLLSALSSQSQAAQPSHWVGSWEAPPAPASVVGWDGKPTPLTVFQNQTVREIVHLTAGGSMVRVRLTNRYGASDLTIGAASVATRATGSMIAPDTYSPLTFGGKLNVIIPRGADVTSDPISLDAAPQSDLAVSLFLPEASAATTMHLQQRSAVYVTSENQVSAVSFPAEDPADAGKPWVWLDGVDVAAPAQAGAVVCFGDSITDGAHITPDAAHEWPNILSQRLQQIHQPGAVLNAALSGNRLLHDGGGPGAFFGVNGLTRFDSDALAVPGVRTVFVLLGLNDIGQPSAGSSESVNADQITWGLTQLAGRAHSQGLKIYVSTFTPMADAAIAGYYSPEKDAEREAVNAWILKKGPVVFDGVVDLDRVLSDNLSPAHLRSAYDSGDHLHPNDAGARAMADAIPLDWFK